MFMGADYIFAIQDKDFRFWKLVNNVVTCNAQPYFLDYAPAGWQDIEVKNVRNRRYWALDRSVSAPLSFVNDGAQILKYILLNKGHEEPVFLSILEQQLYYQPYPKGTLAYTTGQSPFTPNDITTGTITGTPGDTVKVRVYMENPTGSSDTITGNFDAFNFTIYGDVWPYVHEQTFDIIIPVGGIINFSINYTHETGTSTTAGMELLNENGSSEFGYGYWYKQRTRTEFDLTTYNHEGSNVKCTTLEEGLIKFLKANEATTIELPLDVAEAINVKMDGIVLHEKANYVDVDGIEFSPTALGGGASDGLTATTFLTKEGDSIGINFLSQYQSAYGSFGDTISSLNCLIHNLWNTPIIVTIAGTSEFICTRQPNTFAFRRRFLLTSSTVPTQNDYEYHTPGTLAAGVTYTQAYSEVITVPPGERLYTQSQFLSGGGGDPAIEFTPNSKFSISFESRYETTYIKAFRAQYLFDKFIEFVGEGNYSAATAEFFTTHADKVFTCGNAIRGFSDAVMKWDFSGFFQFWDSFSSVGIFEEAGVIDLAEKQDLTDTSLVIDLDEPSNLQVNIDREFLYNVLKIGYPPVKNDIGVLNGNEEFNTEFTFGMGLMKKPGDLDKVSKINASCYAIEKIRVTTFNKETTDFKSDNDVFPLVITDTLIPASGNIPAHYELDRSLNASATGLVEPDTVFNMALSPHLNFKRNGSFLRSCLFLCDYKTLKYQSSDKNNALTFTDPVYGAMVERADENIGGLGDQFFVPVVFNITVPPPDDHLENSPKAVYRFPFMGTYYKGISFEDSTNLAGRKAQSWKLIALPDNNFKKLEAYYG